MKSFAWLLLVLPVLQFGFCWSRYTKVDTGKQKRRLEVFSIFEEALVSDENNLFLLREVFFSSSLYKHPPSFLLVTYTLNFDNSSTLATKQMGWSTSSIFATINPATLWVLQSAILTSIYYSLDIGFPYYIALHLNLKSNDNFWNGTDSMEITNALKEITEKVSTKLNKMPCNVTLNEFNIYLLPQLKPYAIHQKKLTEWDGSNKGFAWDDYDPSGTDTLRIILADIFLVVLSLTFSMKVLSKYTRQVNSRKHEGNITVYLFWSVINITTFTNVFEIFWVIVITIHLKRIVNIMMITTAAILTILGLLVGCMASKKHFPPLQFETCRMCFSNKYIIRFFYCHAMCSYLLGVFFITNSIIPTVIFMCVYPVIVLSTVTFVCTVFVCFVFIFSLPVGYDQIMYTFRSSGNARKLNQQSSELCSKLTLYTLPLIVTALLLPLHLQILSKTEITHSTEFFNVLFSFFPSILMGAITYFIRRTLKRSSKNKEIDTDEHSVHETTEEEKSEATSSDTELV